MSTLLSLSSAQLLQAAKLKDEITSLEKELASVLGNATATASKAPAVAGKRSKMSPAARAKIAAAQRARWAKVKHSKPASKRAGKSAAKAPVKKFKRSAAVKARLSALAKARWARAKAAGKNAL
jgi:hypothetical protein